MTYIYLSMLGIPWLACWFCVYAFAYYKNWRWLEVIAEAFGGPVDVLMNYTWLALFTLDIPRRGEYTFSTRLERLVHDQGMRGTVCRQIAYAINYVLPGHIGGIF
jgi:hypothetical protein